MLVSSEATCVSAQLILTRSGNAVTVDLYYGLSGYYDEELGYYLWSGDISSQLGADAGYVYQDVDRPMDLEYTATLADGVLEAGSYDLNDY
ncbi:MAG TPA: hypothetical protein VGX71_12725 [Pseudaminobacter sp.]|nr:hypothetical protein [Pseudaminobacter sp.]